MRYLLIIFAILSSATFTFADVVSSRFSLEVLAGSESQCVGNVINDGSRLAVATKSHPLLIPTDYHSISMCLSTKEKPTRYEIRLITEGGQRERIFRFKTPEGLLHQIEIQGEAPVCGKYMDCSQFASIEHVSLQCINEGSATAIGLLFLPEEGTSYQFEVQVYCNKLTWGKVTGDLAHVFEAAPLFIYCSWRVIKLLLFRNRKSRLAWIPPDSGIYRLKEIVGEHAENILFFALGIAIIISQYIVDGLKMEDEFNYMHILFGFFISVTAIMGSIFRTKLFKDKSVNFTVPMILVYIGIMFLFHKQFHHFGYVTHRAFGLTCIGTGALAAISLSYPKVEFIMLISGQFAASLFFGSSPYFVIHAQASDMHAMNYVFLLANLIMVWNLVLLGFCLLMKYFLKRNGYDYDEVKEEETELHVLTRIPTS